MGVPALERMAKKCLSEQMTWNLKISKNSEWESSPMFSRNRVSSRQTGRCKYPETALRVGCLRNGRRGTWVSEGWEHQWSDGVVLLAFS